MKISQMIQSKFLRKDDIEDELPVTIRQFKLEDMPGDSGEQRWVIYFKELAKPMVANTTTLRVLEKAYGDESDNWVGQRVVLFVDPNVAYKGQIVGGLRLRPVKRPLPPKAAPLAEEDFEDVIPFGEGDAA